MTEAEVASEIAQRMTRWRRARNRADRVEDAPLADRPVAPETLAAPSAATPAAPAVAGPAAGALPDTAGVRMERALRLAARKAAARLPLLIDAPVESLAALPEPESRTEQAAGHPHAMARSARRAPVRWAVIAAAVVGAGAIVVAIFLPLGQAPPPQLAPRAEAPPAESGASALRTPAPEARAPQQAPPPPAVAAALEQAPLATPAALPSPAKPTSKLPNLAARLKPDGTAATKPSPAPAAQPESAPFPSAPPASPPRAEPQHKSASPAARATGKDDDLNGAFEMMFSDGLGQRLPRRRSRPAPRRRHRLRAGAGTRRASSIRGESPLRAPTGWFGRIRGARAEPAPPRSVPRMAAGNAAGSSGPRPPFPPPCRPAPVCAP
jgi:hypothetical protein